MIPCHLTRSALWSEAVVHHGVYPSKYIAILSFPEAAAIMSLRGHRMDAAEAKRLEGRALRKLFRDQELQAMARDEGCELKRRASYR